jgi:peptidoglycan hydrolase-like protein with peptidoglycan-binding domain
LGAQQAWYEQPKKRLTIGGALVDALADFQRHGGQVDEILTPDDLAGKPPLTYGIQNGRSVFAIGASRDGGLTGLITVDGSSVQASLTPDGFVKLAPDQTGVRNRNMQLYRALFPDQSLEEYTTEAVFEYVDESGKRLLFGGSEDGKTTAFLFKKDPTTGELVYKVERDIAKAKEAKAGWVAPDESSTFPVRFKICDENRDNCVVRNFIKKPGDEIRINPHSQAIKITFNKDILPYHRKYGNAERLGWACEFKGEGFYLTYREGFMGGDTRRLPTRIGNLSCDKNELCCKRTGPGQKCHFDVRDYLDDPPNMMLFALNWLTSRLDRHKQHFTVALDPAIKDHLRVKKFENIDCIKTATPLYSRGTRGNDVPNRVYHSLKSALCPNVGGACSGEPAFTVLEVTGVGEGTTLIDERTGVKLNNVTLAKVYVLRNNYGTGKRGDFAGAIVDNRAGGTIISTLLNMEDQPRAPDLLDKKENIQPDNIEAMLAEMKKEEEAEEIQREVLSSRQRALVLFPTRHGWGFDSQPRGAKRVALGRRPARIVLLPPSEEPAPRFASAQQPRPQSSTSRYSTSASRYGTRTSTRTYSNVAPQGPPARVAPPRAYSRSSGPSAYGSRQPYTSTQRAQGSSYPTAYNRSTRTTSPYGYKPTHRTQPSPGAYGTAPSYSAQRPSGAPSNLDSPPGQTAPPPQYTSGSRQYYRTATSRIAPTQPPKQTGHPYSRPRIPLRLPVEEETLTSATPTVRRTVLRPSEVQPAEPQPGGTRMTQELEPLTQVRPQDPESIRVAKLAEPEPVRETKLLEAETVRAKPVLVTPSLVREVQRRLKRQGYRISNVDGRLGPETSKAIWRFQRDVSLQPTGRIDRPFLTSLGIESENGWHKRRSSSPRSYSTRSYSKSWKPSKNEIKEVQRRLALIGFKPGPADGLMGAQTSRAVKQFQSQVGLRQSGRINKEVLKRLSIVK